MLEIVLKMVISPAAEHSLEENATNEQTVATTKQIQKKNFGFLFPFFFSFLNLSTGFVGSVFPHCTDEEIETQRYWSHL